MEGAIRKKSEKEWNELKNKHVVSNPKINLLIKDLVENEGAIITNTVVDLFPIHPYTSLKA